VYASLWNTAYYVLFPCLWRAVVAVSRFVVEPEIAGISLFRTIFFLPSVTNMVAVSILWMWVFNPEFGLLNRVCLLGISGPLWLQSETWAKPALILMSLWGVGGV